MRIYVLAKNKKTRYSNRRAPKLNRYISPWIESGFQLPQKRRHSTGGLRCILPGAYGTNSNQSSNII
jgi:hypothetical protein